MRGDDPDRTRVELLDPLIGVALGGRYRIELRIAQGGFGAIYRALDLESGGDVAVKVLHPRLASDPAVIARFRREGAALARLRDPHTVMAYDLGETADGWLYIVMELLEGETLYDHYRELGPLAWRRVVAIARAVCSSLAEAHALGIVHRDLKPANIHLERRGDERDFVKVLDFGIAKIVHGGALDSSELTHAGQMIGTFDYMPPEQMVGGECTGQSDVFTLGVVMYEMIAGVRPFGEPATAASMLAALLHTVPRPLRERADVPPELDGIVRRCLSHEPAERPGVHALAAALDRLLDDDDRTRTHLEPAPATAQMDAVTLEDVLAQISTTDKMTPISRDEAAAGSPARPDAGDDATWIDTAPKRPKMLPSTTIKGVGPAKKKRR